MEICVCKQVTAKGKSLQRNKVVGGAEVCTGTAKSMHAHGTLCVGTSVVVA